MTGLFIVVFGGAYLLTQFVKKNPENAGKIAVSGGKKLAEWFMKR